MATLAYRDDKFLARNLLPYPFFCLTPAEPFFRPDRSSTAPSCRVAVKDGRAFRGHPKGLSLTAARTMARWRSRGGRHAWQRSRPRHHGDRRGFPVPVPAVSTEVRELLSGSPSIISISRPSNCLLLLMCRVMLASNPDSPSEAAQTSKVLQLVNDVGLCRLPWPVLMPDKQWFLKLSIRHAPS